MFNILKNFIEFKKKLQTYINSCTAISLIIDLKIFSNILKLQYFFFWKFKI